MIVPFLSRKRLALLAVVGSLLCAAAGAQTALTYDVVSIRPYKSGDGMVRVMNNVDSYSGSNVTLEMLIQMAYDLKTESLISGLPGWATSSHWDISAKMDADTVAAVKKMSREERTVQGQQMMQALLAERFHMKVHHETREMQTYTLSVARSGLKIKEADPNNPYANGLKGLDGQSHPGMMMMGDGKVTAQAITMPVLVRLLSNVTHKQVVDNTGLKGKYDIVLEWQPEDEPVDHTDGSPATPKPSLATALQEQVGLRLDSVKAPVDTIVVDHIEMPTEN